jgi:hypothetical protein
MKARRKSDAAATQMEWTLPLGATLGSAVRAKGILLELRARLPWPMRKLLDIEAGLLTMQMPEGSNDEARVASATVSRTLEDINDLPVIPREVEDVLSITASERHRWLKDGRLQSAGTRTVKLRGRARKITFHVFDPQHIEDVLDRDLVTVWREQDAMTAAENRRRAAAKAAMSRAPKAKREAASASGNEREKRSGRRLDGWEEFERGGLLK